MTYQLPNQNVPLVSAETGRLSHAGFQFLARLLRDIGNDITTIANILESLGADPADIEDIIAGNKTFSVDLGAAPTIPFIIVTSDDDPPDLPAQYDETMPHTMLVLRSDDTTKLALWEPD